MGLPLAGRAIGLDLKVGHRQLNLAINALAYLELNRWVRARYYSNAPLPTLTGILPLPDFHEKALPAN